jgi:hypothetical protein
MGCGRGVQGRWIVVDAVGSVVVVERFELAEGLSRCVWFQIKVRSRSSRRQVCIHRSVIELDRTVDYTASGRSEGT